MSDPAKPPASSDASATGKKPQGTISNLRPLAPKPLPPPPPAAAQPLAIRTTTPSATTTDALRRRSPAACPVCLRVGCQLSTHSAYTQRSRSSAGSSPEASSSLLPQRDPIFASSYAYKLGQSYFESSATAVGVVPSYDLPIGIELNTPEMHRLFHSWFIAQAHNSLLIPRPPEMVGDPLWNPFFLPALQDPLLCLSVLAASATLMPRYSNQQARNVMSLTLLGQAIQLMRERISMDPVHVSDITIVAAVFIWIVNILLEDTISMASHANSIYAFVESRGGLDELGMVGAVARCIRWVDVLQSIILSQACHYVDPPNPGPFPNAPPTKYGTLWDHEYRASKSGIDPSLITVCQKSCRLIEMIEHTESQGCTAAEHTQMADTLCALHTKASVLRATYHEQGQLDECIIGAISLIHWQCFQRVKILELGVRANATRLANAIQSTGNPSFWQKDPELLTWLLVAVVMTPFAMPQLGWCSSFLGQVIATQYGTSGKLREGWQSELRACLHQFAWSDLRLEDVFIRVCRLISMELGQSDTTAEDTDGET